MQQSTVPEVDSSGSRQLVLDTLPEATAVRDNGSAPILAIVTVGDVVYPYVYGYPIHPEVDTASGVLQFRVDNAAGAKRSDEPDQDGVVHATEALPAVACTFEGYRETPDKYVPVSMSCELPAPRALGGNKRPVLGGLNVGAKAEDVLKEPTVQENFLGEFHLTSDNFATGSGTGFFNTTHGQLALVFANKKLARFVYYFDPEVKAWQNPAHWVTP